jgi:outer membrane protein TolC
MTHIFARRLGAALLTGFLPCSALHAADNARLLAADNARLLAADNARLHAADNARLHAADNARPLAAGTRAPMVRQTPAPMLGLTEVVEAARENNPQILAARAQARAAAALPAQARAWDDPVVSWEAWNVPGSLAVHEADNNIFRVAQRIPFPGKRELAGTIASGDAEAAARATDATELDVVAAVTRAYWDFWEAHQRLQIYGRDKELAQRFARVAEQKYGVGEVPQADVLRAQVELTHALTRLATGPLAIASAGAELNALLSRPPDAPLGTPQDPSVAAPDVMSARLIALALQHRPELGQQRAMIARDRTGLALARRASLPDFEVSVSRFVNEGADDGFGAMLSMTVPLAFRSKIEAGITAATAQLSAAEATRRRLEDQIRREVQQALIRLQTARVQHDLLVTTHIPQAEQTLRVTEGAYQAGAVSFLDLIEVLRMIESAHLEHVQAGAEIGKARADLERAVGTTLAADEATHE